MKPRSPATFRRIFLLLILLILSVLVALLWVGQPLLEERGIHLPFPNRGSALSAAPTVPAHEPEQSATPTASPEPTITLSPTVTVPPLSLSDPAAAAERLQADGVLVLAMQDGYYTHLFAYHPLFLPLSRLTNNPWDDMHPALSPDGKRLAYTSRRNGYWDLYILDLETGKQARLTDTADYEGAPTWSPDGLWIAYERYTGAGLDIFIVPTDNPTAEPIRLTDDPGLDRSPAWSPQGREIAFVSSRSGDEEVWLARLDNVDERYENLSQSSSSRERFPVWSQDGNKLSWTTERDGDRQLALWNPGVPFGTIAKGDFATWSPDGQILMAEVRGPNQTALAGYDVSTGRFRMLPLELPGALHGMTWVRGPLPEWLANTLQNPDTTPGPVLWQPAPAATVAPGGRVGLINLQGVSAPNPMLNDATDDAFIALRDIVAATAGWDALSSLENAYMALTTPPTPSMREDWLYTGRAFAMNPLLLSAGWMSIVREDFEGETYWRVFLKARYQDGSMGMPLTEMVWDINARFEGDTRSYEQGGRLGTPPAGYWIDLTELAGRYGWERLPSRINWRTFFPGIRFNQFVMTGGLDWYRAMEELYPREALMTGTPPPTYTPQPSRTPATPATPTPVPPTATATEIPARRPTWTPLPNESAP